MNRSPNAASSPSSLSLIRCSSFFVVRNLDGSQKSDGQANAVILRICRRAGLPEKRWHTLRHTFGTHAALFGVNPWRLQSWMGHKRIDETMIYVHVAENHRREIPEPCSAAALNETAPDRRVLAMLLGWWQEPAKDRGSENRNDRFRGRFGGGDKGDRTQSAQAEMIKHLAFLQ